VGRRAYIDVQAGDGDLRHVKGRIDDAGGSGGAGVVPAKVVGVGAEGSQPLGPLAVLRLLLHRETTGAMEPRRIVDMADRETVYGCEEKEPHMTR